MPTGPLRRHILALAAEGAAAWPIGLAAQQRPGTRRLRVLSQGSASTHPAATFRAFLSTLAAAGWVEGTNLVIDWRFSEGSAESLPALMAELLALHPVPIVFAQVADSIEAGIVSNLAHPGGNITGTSNMAADASGRRRH